ncbi:MAG: hypothetical protein JNK45_04070 [Myxococcales bacterium]|nr:hypothetical protein [Myxococcales bacterium]
MAAATALALALAPAPARAGEPDAASSSAEDAPAPERAAALRKQAEQKYFDDDFEGALEDFARAWELSPHPTDLFNMGRIHEEKGELVEAVRRYEQFVEQPRIPLEERALVAERLEVLRVLVAEQTAPSPPPPRPTNTEQSGRTTMTDDPRAKSVRPLVISGSTLAGVGAAIALAGGLGFGLAARRHSRRIDRLGDGSNPERLGLAEAEDLDARGRDLESLQIASVAAGAALVVLGAALLTTGLVRRRAAARNDHVTAHVLGLRSPWRF